MHSTESDVNLNSKVKVALGAREAIDYNNYQGTGFEVGGTTKFLTSGSEFDMMKEKYPFLSRVLEITVTSAKQLL